MSSGTSFAFDPLPATQSATGPQLSPQRSQWIMGNCNAYVLKKHPDSVSLKVEPYNGESRRGNKKKKKNREEKVNATLGIKLRTREVI